MSEPASTTALGTLYAFVLDVNDLETCARFWRQLLGVDVLYQDQSYVRLGQQGAQPTLLLQRVPERRGGKNRAHLDLDVTDLAAAVSRAQELGGQQLRAVNEYGIAWVVMADPDGNEFCLIQHRRE
jgi:predicted enzyme related to lactoylglutathione lyase